MPPPVASRKVSELLPWAGAWLPAGDLVLAGGQVATVSFARGGHCRLLLALDRPAEDEDVLALEEAAEALPYLQLSDLEGGAGYPARHADAFALREPLSSFAFNSSARVQLVARRGGRRLPPRLGTFGLATTTSFLGDPLPEAGRLEAPPSEPEAQRPEAPDAEPETTAGLAVAQTPEAPAHVAEAEAPEPRAHTAEAEAPDPEVRAPSAEAEAPAAQALAPEAKPAARARAAPETDGLATAAPDMAAPDMAAPDMAAPDMAAAAPDVAAVGAPGTGLERGLGALGARLTAATGLAGTTLGLAVAVFVGVFVAQTWALHRHFGTYGFDVGIYDQGTWLLSRLRAPFVTVRGLNLFGDHASYI